MRNFMDLRVWKAAHQLTLHLYRLTAKFPKDELYGLTSQIRRAAVSIEANLAEGCGRESDGESHRFTQISSGSASELSCHLLIARDLSLLQPKDYEAVNGQLMDIRRMLRGYLDSLAAGAGV